MRQHTVNLNYMRLTKSGFKQVLHMRLTVDMRLITRVYGSTIHIICKNSLLFLGSLKAIYLVI